MKTLIPGQSQLFSGSGEFPRSVLLLAGPSGSGKTAYCMQFLREGLYSDHCVYINCSPALTEERFLSFFAKAGAPKFISLFAPEKSADLSDFLERIKKTIESGKSRVVLDSLTDLIARFPDEAVKKFAADLYDLLKVSNAAGFFVIAGSTSAADAFGSLVDGIIQLRMDDSGDDVQRSMRLLSLKASHNTPKWIGFQIREDGSLQFAGDSKASQAEAVCKLCSGPIIGAIASTEPESTFHPHCLDTYRKLGDIYGSHILYALQPGVVNANFFFIDIVGLSNPLLSVEKQIGKIEDLNELIGSCDAYSKVPKDKKIVLPTGDGMAIGFLLNPELPLQLSMQLHRKLGAFNAKTTTADRAIGVRIGLSSGPVFVVSDINNNQNVWGPGIILARRVMDLGDNGHILLADNLAETLMNLKDEYREIIKPISAAYKIKHGQQLKLYSAYSSDFGNPAVPMRIES